MDSPFPIDPNDGVVAHGDGDSGDFTDSVNFLKRQSILDEKRYTCVFLVELFTLDKAVIIKMDQRNFLSRSFRDDKNGWMISADNKFQIDLRFCY